MATFNATLAKDSFLLSAAPTYLAGGLDYLALYDAPTSKYRSILEMLISGLPAGATITAATLSLYYYGYVNADPNGLATNAYKVTRTNWVEAEVCWNYYLGTTGWTAAGGDFVTTNPAGATTNIPAAVGWVDYDILAIVQNAYANSIPVEVLLKFTNESQVESHTPLFRSKEYGSNIPKLVITYTPAAVGRLKMIPKRPWNRMSRLYKSLSLKGG